MPLTFYGTVLQNPKAHDHAQPERVLERGAQPIATKRQNKPDKTRTE